MQDPSAAQRLPSLTSVVRVHADRVHDAALRLGRGPAGEVVERTALELLALVDRDPAAAADPVGTWFRLVRAAPVAGPAAPADGEPARALRALPEDQRLALLLRDAYDLPPATLATAVDRDADGAADLLRRARLALLDAAAEPQRTQERARWLMARLVVVPLPDAERTRLLTSVEAAGELPGVSPTAPTVVGRAGSGSVHALEDRPRRSLSPLAVLLGLALAVALGLGAGLLLVRSPGGIDPALAGGALPLVTAPPAPTPAPPSAEQVERARAPQRAETRVFTLPPRTLPPPPPPTPEPTTPAPAAPPVLTVDPSSGPAGQDLAVSGTGWTPGVDVTVSYLTAEGRPTGAQAVGRVDAQGAFRAVLPADDPENLPGPHSVSATDGTLTAAATYDVQP